jgi:exopolysaccharide biosynthesis polyprenyl glycosylphosphotransferase
MNSLRIFWMKKSDLQFGALLVPLDYLMIVAAGLAAYAVRFSDIYIKYIREATVIIQLADYVTLVLLIALAWLVVFALAGLYNLRTYRKIWDEIAKVVMACSTGILAVVIFIFLNRELFASRFIVLAAWVLAVLFVSAARLIAREIQRSFFRKGWGLHRIILVGSNETAKTLSRIFDSHSGHGMRIAHRFADFTSDKAKLLSEIVQRERVDEVLLADPNLPPEQRYLLVDSVNELNLDFKYAADLLGLARTNTEITTLSGIPIVEVKKTPLDGWGRIAKRIFDLLLSSIGLFILLPGFLLIALAIKLDSKGPVFYRSWRVGGRGQKFGLYKFRSMKPNAHEIKYSQLQDQNVRQDGPLFKMKSDPRVTRIGRFLRRWSIDELPQLINVIKGEVSLVGPRPHEPEEVAKYEKHQKRLLDIKPGMTGMAQVSGRSYLRFEEEVKLDVYYIENWSLWLDMKILLQTPRAVLSNTNAE